jgi:hypothetical protein
MENAQTRVVDLAARGPLEAKTCANAEGMVRDDLTDLIPGSNEFYSAVYDLASHMLYGEGPFRWDAER